MSSKLLAPREAKTFEEICSLQTDHKDLREYWLLLDVGKVYLHRQKEGETSTVELTLTRSEFNRLVDWYQRPQKVRKTP